MVLKQQEIPELRDIRTKVILWLQYNYQNLGLKIAFSEMDSPNALNDGQIDSSPRHFPRPQFYLSQSHSSPWRKKFHFLPCKNLVMGKCRDERALREHFERMLCRRKSWEPLSHGIDQGSFVAKLNGKVRTLHV